MSTTLSLKSHKENSALKDQIVSLQNEINTLHEKNAAQVDIETKLKSEIVELKEDYVHLEEQFDVFATLEQSHESLQHEIQLERLTNIIEKDKVKAQFQAKLKQAQQETNLVNSELKKLKALDPTRLKRQLADGKKKTASQQAANDAIKVLLNKTRDELKKSKADAEQLTLELNAFKNETNCFWISKDGVWSLSLTDFSYKDEEANASSKVRCLNRETGASFMTKALDDEQHVIWNGTDDVPNEVSQAAGAELAKMAESDETESE